MEDRRFRAVLLGLAVELCVVGVAAAQPAALVKDIRTAELPDASTLDPGFPRSLAAAGAKVFFSGLDEAHGPELWVSDGTAAGTRLVKDIRAGQDGSWPSGFVSIGSVVFFVANGQELWRSDGTAAGTFVLKHIELPYPRFGNNRLLVVGSTLFFSAEDEVHGEELWRSDGTEAGTVLVRDLVLGVGSPSPVVLAGDAKGWVYFSAGNYELWRSDGTAEGTVPLGLWGGPLTSRQIVSVGNAVYLTAFDASYQYGLWKTDGTPSGARLVKRYEPLGSLVADDLTPVGTDLFFTEPMRPGERRLWRTDGSEQGTVALTGPLVQSANLTAVGGTLFFTAYESWASPGSLWKSDGSPAGTVRVKDIEPSAMIDGGGILYLLADDGVNGLEPWRSDGTPGGTRLIRDLRPGRESSGRSLGCWTSGALYSIATDGTNGYELWKTDGTSEGTRMLTDARSRSSFPSLGVEVGGSLFFTADDIGWLHLSRGLWKSDGTTGGTRRLGTMAGGPSMPRMLTRFHDALWFTGGGKFWRSDGTDAGTVPLANFPVNVGWMGVAGESLFLTSYGSPRTTLWKSSGAAQGVVTLATHDLLQTIGSLGGHLIFGTGVWTNGGRPDALWRTDGTPSGTSRIAGVELPWASVSYDPVAGAAAGRALFFVVSDRYDALYSLWKTDGTSQGTARLKEFSLRAPGIEELVAANERVFFVAVDESHGRELWTSDGTEAGTHLVADIVTGGASSRPRNLVSVGGTLFFSAQDAQGDVELWRSDGTEPGTYRVRDIQPGPGSSSPRGLRAVNGLLYFAANDDANGWELWRSDGTETGTALVQDIAVGGASSDPRPLGFTPAGLFFAADDGQVGNELWLLPAADLGPDPLIVTAPAAGAVVQVPGLRVTWTAVSGAQSYHVKMVNIGTGVTAFGPWLPAGSTGTTVNPPNGSYRLDLEACDGVGACVYASVSFRVEIQAGAVGMERPQPVWHSFFAVDTRETPYVGDFDGDGKTDIITFTRQNPLAFGDVYVALSEGTKFGNATKWHDFFAIDSRETVVIGDYDGDGKDDIATWLGTTSRQVYVALSFGTGMTHESVWVDSIGFDPTDILAAGDVNGDGKADLVMFARKKGQVYVALSNGTKFSPPTLWHSFFAVSTYERPRAADLNGDGQADIVTFATDSPTAFGDVYVAISDGTKFGDGRNSVKWHDFFAIQQTETVRIGDLDGDGKDDFFTFLPPPFAQSYTVLSEGNQMGLNVLWREAVAPKATDQSFVGDVNGDGKADIIVFAQDEGRAYVSLALP